MTYRSSVPPPVFGLVKMKRIEFPSDAIRGLMTCRSVTSLSFNAVPLTSVMNVAGDGPERAQTTPTVPFANAATRGCAGYASNDVIATSVRTLPSREMRDSHRPRSRPNVTECTTAYALRVWFHVTSNSSLKDHVCGIGIGEPFGFPARSIRCSMAVASVLW